MYRFNDFSLVIPLLLLAAVTSCKKARLGANVSNPNLQNPATKPILIEAPKESTDPRALWQKKVQPALKDVSFAAQGNFDFKNPDLKSWLKTSSSKGAVRWILSLPKAPAGAFDELATSFDNEKAPKSLLFFLELPAKSKIAKPRHFFFVIKGALKSSPYAEACNFLDEWIRAQQVLEAQAKLSDLGRVEVDCTFSWEAQAPSPLATYQLVVSRLALPYVDAVSGDFPFKSLAESLELSAFKNLR